jgi:GTP-binding protein Era
VGNQNDPYEGDSLKPFKSGFVAIIGAPNVGKSTLLNRLLGEKLSITSQKPQTTRNRILGIVHRPGAQLVFIDTPGIHRAKSPLNTRIVRTALASLDDADLILLVVDAFKPDHPSETLLLEALKKHSQPVFLVLNKIDRVAKPPLLDLIRQWARQRRFLEVVPVSAKRGTQVELLLAAMEKHLPQGPPYYADDSLTDVPQRFIAAEIIREKVFRLTGQEIPYATAVTIEAFSGNRDAPPVRILATIHVERESQKGIVIGRGGTLLKRIGQSARRDLERMLDSKVYLKLFVRVQKNWSKDGKALRKFGY